MHHDNRAPFLVAVLIVLRCCSPLFHCEPFWSYIVLTPHLSILKNFLYILI